MWDEDLSLGVAKALVRLDLNVHYIPGYGLKKGDPDEDVVAIALKQGRVIFSHNFDMIMTASSLGCQTIWLDVQPSPTKFRQAKLVFEMWEQWERSLSDPNAECIRTKLSKFDMLTYAEAYAEAEAKFERSARARARAEAKMAAGSQERLAIPEDEG